MFYPDQYLKKGGRFYLCWVADSCPPRFADAMMTRKQLWSLDIRRLCDDLMKVMNDETGRTVNRFSLRLSSQLLRGLVRIFHKKTSILLADVCMLSANATKAGNKKSGGGQKTPRAERTPGHRGLTIAEVVQELPEEPRPIEEILQQSGNIVGNIEEITLKESAIPDAPQPNDNFGAEGPESALQLATGDRTLEMMLAGETQPAPHTPALAADLSAEGTGDAGKLQLLTHTMERISELDLTMRKSVGDGLMPEAELDKELPKTPEILKPAPDPHTDKELTVSSAAAIRDSARAKQQPSDQGQDSAEEKQLVQPTPELELEQVEAPRAKRRRRVRGLLIDKKIILDTQYLRARIHSTNIELRCQSSIEDVIDLREEPAHLFRRAAHGHPAPRGMAASLTRFFQRKAAVVPHKDTESHTSDAERALVDRVARAPSLAPCAPHPQPLVVETEVPPVPHPAVSPQLEVNKDTTVMVEAMEVEPPALNVTVPALDVELPPTQIVRPLSSQPPAETRKRSTVAETEVVQRRRRRISRNQPPAELEPQPELPDVNKENIEPIENVMDAPSVAVNVPSTAIDVPLTDKENVGRESCHREVNVMLQRVGLADLPPDPLQERVPEQSQSRRHTAAGSDSSEPQQGSLDRTAVSLGDPQPETDSQRLIRLQWGAEGTMLRVLRCLQSAGGGGHELTVSGLLRRGPLVPGCRALIAARCFNSLLKLKQHGFVTVEADPVTREIVNITLGPTVTGAGLRNVRR